MATEKNIALNDNMQKILDSKERNDRIFKNYDYLNWLEKYMSDRLRAYDDDYIFEENSNEIDYNNILKFDNFFSEIEKYAQDNFIPIETKQGKTYYKIKYNNVAYNVGIIYTQGMAYYVDKVENADLDKYIDVQDIKNNVVQEKTQPYKNRLEELKKDILKAYSYGIDVKFIEEAVNQSLDEITKSSEENIKIKKIKKCNF